MSDIPYAESKTSTYENFEATCPRCEHRNVFNRASDLLTLEPIAFKTVSCEGCSRLFNINGDTVNPNHEKLVLDCHRLIREKRYRDAVLALAQAYEVFGGLYLRAELVYRPLALGDSHDLGRANKILKRLHDKTKKWSFDCLRAAVLWHLVSFEAEHESLEESEAALERMPNIPKLPSNRSLERLEDTAVRRFALGLKQTKANELRNAVVHQAARRPTLNEVEFLFDETRGVLLPACFVLAVYDDVNFYMCEPRRGNSRRKLPEEAV